MLPDVNALIREQPFQIGQRVRKCSGAYVGPGTVCGFAWTLEGEPRVVVAHTIEGGHGHLMHIYSPSQLEPVDA